MILKLTIAIFFILGSGPKETDAVKLYAKDYYANGQLKSEGWSMGDMKVKYWKFYHSNGTIAAKGHFSSNKKTGYWYFYREDGSLEREGHYNSDIAEKWWIFYDLAERNKEKVEYQNNKKNGYSLVYKGRKLVKVKKYRNDQRIGEWTDKKSFKRDNPEIRLTTFGFIF